MSEAKIHDSHTATVNSGDKNDNKSLKSILTRKSSIIIIALFVIIGGGFAWAKAATTSYSLWTNAAVPKTITDTDTQSVELGTKFQSKYAGQVTGVKFYKGAQNTGTHTGSLWDNSGKLLATVTFANETASGWQTANFAQPINIAANVTYIISYHAPNGHYSDDTSYFAQSLTNGPLTAPADTSPTTPGGTGTAQGYNGVYSYSKTSSYPNQGYQKSNYWVDVIFQTSLISPTTAPAPPTTVTATQVANGVKISWSGAQSSNGIAKYRIVKNGSYLLAVGGKTTSYTDTSVTAGQTYTYQVKTVDNNNVESARSIAATVTYNTSPPATCPVGQTGTPPNCSTPVSTTPGMPCSDHEAGTTEPNCRASDRTTGTVPCALTQAAELCWESDTGVLNGTGWNENAIVAGRSTLTHITSSSNAPAGTTISGNQMSVNTAGTVIKDIWFDGCIGVHAANVTIEDSLIRGQVGCSGGDGTAAYTTINTGGAQQNNNNGVTNAQIIDTTVDGQNVNFDFSGIGGGGFTCIRCESVGYIHGIWAGVKATVQDSLVHSLSPVTNGLHQEAGEADTATNVVYRHNYLDATASTSSTGALMNGGSWGPASNMTIDNNFLMGGNGADLVENCSGNTNLTVTNNAFSDNNGYGGTEFYYGLSIANDTGLVWSGNYIPEQANKVLPANNSC